MSGRVDESDSDVPEEFTAQQVGSILALKSSTTTTHIYVYLISFWSRIEFGIYLFGFF